MPSPPFHVVIPSRFAATRLPGKPLRLIAGLPMIEHVYRRALESAAASVCVATDDARIQGVVEGFGGKAHMTSADHTSGTDRLAEVADIERWPEDAIVVNLQGDEPCMDPRALTHVAALLADGAGDIATLATPIRASAELFSPDVVKVIVDDAGLARWFTRAPVPWVRQSFEASREPPAELPSEVPFLRHLGIYAYRIGALRRVAHAAPHPHELAESLEQLRALAMGLRIRVGVRDEAPGHGVDTEADLARAEALLSGLSGASAAGGVTDGGAETGKTPRRA